MQQQKLDLSDSIFNVGILLVDTHEIFSLKIGSVVPSTYLGDKTDQIVCSVVYRSSLDRIRVTRVAYGLLDYLADIGGLFGTFNGFATVTTLVLNFNGVYHLLTSGLFSVETNII